MRAAAELIVGLVFSVLLWDCVRNLFEDAGLRRKVDDLTVERDKALKKVDELTQQLDTIKDTTTKEVRADARKRLGKHYLGSDW